MTGGDFTHDEILLLTANKLGRCDVACPRCGPTKSTKANQERTVLRIWFDKPDFATYNCASCGINGHTRDDDAKVERDPVAEARLRIERQKHNDDYAQERVRLAQWLWRFSKPAAGTVVEAYLAGRDIAINPMPATIRFLPTNEKHPYSAMIAPFGIPDEPEPGVLYMLRDCIRGIHLTYLMPDGSGKAPVDPPRKMIGKVAGSPLVLAAAQVGLLIAEGIETALSGHLDTGLGAWAAGAAGFMPALADAVPDYVECVTVAVESDPAGKRGAEELIDRLTARGLDTMKMEV